MQMPEKVDHQLVELLIQTADGTDEDIIQVVNRVGIQPALEVVFGELLLDLEPPGEADGPLTIQYDVSVSHIVLSHLVVRQDGVVEVRQGDWRSATRPARPAPDARVKVTHSLLEFVALFRAALGAAAAGDGPAQAARALAAGSTESERDWLAAFERRSRERADLKQLAVRFGADKWGVHYYTSIYDRHFGHLRDRRLRILEIGIGGYGDPRLGGASLQVWKRYFPRSLVYGIDIADKSELESQRVRTFQGDQSDVAFLGAVLDEIGPVDLVVDDGSHVCGDQIASFQFLFPRVAANGHYVVEDLETSYWPGFGGSADPRDDAATAMGYFKRLADGMNYEELLQPDYEPSYLDRNIVGLHFFHSLAILDKGANAEGSAGALVPQAIKVDGFPRDQSQIRPDQW